LDPSFPSRQRWEDSENEKKIEKEKLREDFKKEKDT